MRKQKKFISLFLTLLLCLSMINPLAFAGNNDTLPSDPDTATGLSSWKFSPDYEGIRLSLYWAPLNAQGEFDSGGAIRLGKVTDITKTGPRYKIQEYTGKSVFDYQNEGVPYMPIQNFIREYKDIRPSDYAFVNTLPKVFNGSKSSWDSWFESDNYRNVSNIATLLGADLTSEDFVTGMFRDTFGEPREGIYKFYLEPIIYPTIDGKGTVLTLKDALAWEKSFRSGTLRTNGNRSITSHLVHIFEYLANSQFLTENYKTI